MSDELNNLTFDSEKQEADWWYDNRDTVEEEFRGALAKGKVSWGVPQPPPLIEGVVKLHDADLAKAKLLADREGIPYEDYVLRILHEALEQKTAA